MPSVAPEPDIDVDALRARDAAAFDLCFTVYAPRLNGFLLRLGAARPVAEELVQEVFLRLARHAPTLAPDTRIGAWLYTVARNLYRSHRRWAWVDGARLIELLQRRPDRPATPADHAVAHQTAAAVERAVAALPEPLREVFLLVVAEGLDPAEAAQVVGVSPELARQRLSRARRAIQESL